MSRNRKRSDQVTAILLAVFMALSVPAVYGAAAAAGPTTPDNTTGDSPTNDTTVPTDLSALETADAVLEDQQGDATLARTQVDLTQQLWAIADDPSRSDREQAVDMADAMLEQRKQWAAKKNRPLSPGMVPLFETSQTKLKGANLLLESDESLQDENGLTRAVSKAKQGTKMQAALADKGVTLESGLPSVETQNHASPSAATMAIMDRYGVTPTAGDLAAMQELDNLPEPKRSAITDYLDAFLAFQRTTAEGDFTRTLTARNQLLDATATLNDALENTDPPGVATPQHNDEVNQDVMGNHVGADAENSVNGKTQIGCVEASVHEGATQSVGPVTQEAGVQIDGHFCVLQMGNSNDQVYNHNTVVLIDEGGNDEYHMNAGGTNLDDDTSSKTNPFEPSPNGAFDEQHGATNVSNPFRPFPPGFLGENKQVPINNSADFDVAAALVDLGSGNDNYTRSEPIGWGQRGGAHIGSGFLVDEGGSDQYGNSTAFDSHFGTNGGAVGLLSDTDDCCTDTVATGFLLDIGSNDETGNANKPQPTYDTYRAGSVGANGGATKGGQKVAGFLMDMAGKSNYTAYSMGTNGGASESQGLLADLGTTTDRYKAEALGTNGGSLYTGAPPGCSGTPATCSPGGFIVDNGGGDEYHATSQGTNGGGHSQSNGFIMDDGTGTDTYQAGHSYEQDVAERSPSSFDTGPLSRQAGIQGVNGGGYEGGLGLIVDVEDTTNYLAGDGQGSNGGGYLQGYGQIVDTGGDDTYKAGIGYTKDNTSNFSNFPNNPGFPPKITHPSAGSNGGAATGGVGGITDTAGSDDYIAEDGQFGGVNGTNAGGWSLGTGAVGLIADRDGKDTYKATAKDGPVTGANGGGSGFGRSSTAATLDPTFAAKCQVIEDLNGAQNVTNVPNKGPCRAPAGTALRATGTLVDNGTTKNVPGNGKGLIDKYIATAKDTTADGTPSNETVAGANGGAFNLTSTGLLVDERGGGETYKAVAATKTQGVNGGVHVPLVDSLTSGTANAPGTALLLDAAGDNDEYTDDNCGTTTDDTVLPKGIAGAQIDSTEFPVVPPEGCN